MDRVFNSDNKFFRAVSKIIDCIIVSCCWVICNVPVLFIAGLCLYSRDLSVTWFMFFAIIFSFLSGPANAALYYACVKNIRHNHSYVWTEFWHGFKENFKQATATCFLMFIVITVLIFDILYFVVNYYQMALGPFAVIFIIVLLLTLMWMTNIFSYGARFSDKTKVVIKNSAIIGIANLPKSFVQAFLLLIAAMVCYLVPVALAIVPALYALLKSLLMEKTFRRYMSEEDLAEEDERNREEK